MNIETIPISELFEDLQESLTKTVLIELLKNIDPERAAQFDSVLSENIYWQDTIKTIMQYRFSADDIAGFLNNGYPINSKLRGNIHCQDTIKTIMQYRFSADDIAGF